MGSYFWPQIGITVHDAAKVVTDKDLFFFEKVKRILPEAVYANFLKSLTLFNNEIVSKTEVINLVSPMIGKSPDLFHELHRILGVELPEALRSPTETHRLVPSTTPPTQIQIVSRPNYPPKESPKVGSEPWDG